MSLHILLIVHAKASITKGPIMDSIPFVIPDIKSENDINFLGTNIKNATTNALNAPTVIDILEFVLPKA